MDLLVITETVSPLIVLLVLCAVTCLIVFLVKDISCSTPCEREEILFFPEEKEDSIHDQLFGVNHGTKKLVEFSSQGHFIVEEINGKEVKRKADQKEITRIEEHRRFNPNPLCPPLTSAA